MTKRIIAAFLILVTMISMLPLNVAAENTQTVTDASDVTLEGENSFGTLLTDEIEESQTQAEDTYAPGYSISDLIFDGQAAAVTYETQEDALLVVAVYTEDGIQLLNSATLEVSAEETEAIVEFAGEMPEYFYASAYLLAADSLAPLCESYSTPLYTQDMQQLMASTIHDYDADRVMNLDDDETTNFAVYAEDTIVIDKAEGVNTVVSIDDETDTYVIENADENITGLTVGDVFVYHYDDSDMLIVNVAAISVEGTTVTITGGELSIHDVFSYIKIEAGGNPQDSIYDGTDAAEIVTYGGREYHDDGITTYAIQDIQYGSFSDVLLLGNAASSGGSEYAKIEVSGSITIDVYAFIDYYLTLENQYVKFNLSPTLKVDATLSGSFSGDIPLGEIRYIVVPGVFNVDVKWAIAVGFNAKFHYEGTYTTKMVFMYNKYDGFQDRSTSPTVVDDDLEASGTVSIGFKISAVPNFVDDDVIKLELSFEVGIEAVGKPTGTVYEPDPGEVLYPSRHDCSECLDIDVNLYVKLSGTFKILDIKWLEFPFDIWDHRWHLFDAYYSLDTKKFGIGGCPNLVYRVTVEVLDWEGNPLEGVTVSTSYDGDWGATNASGILYGYVPKYTDYDMELTYGDVQRTADLYITRACKYKLHMKVGGADDDDEYWDPTESTEPTTDGIDFEEILEDVETDNFVDNGVVTASGTCGDNVSWELYESGLLKIYGTGDMKDYARGSSVPWYRQRTKITSAQVTEGVTSIGAYAFYYCSNMTSCEVPASVVKIGDYAFAYCSALSSLTVSASVTSLGRYPFQDCTALTSAGPIGSGCDFEFGWTETIPDYAFALCRELERVELPDTIIEIGVSAFSSCSKLSSITLPDTVTTIGSNAFTYCSSLTSVTVPDTVTTIGSNAFSYCSSLAGITIPDGVTELTDFCFYDCSSLSEVTIPNSVTKIGMCTFDGCAALTEIEVPDSVTEMMSHVFEDCTSLTSVTIPASVTYTGGSIFTGCEKLTTAGPIGSGCDIEFGWTEKIPDCAFDTADTLTSISLPDTITNIGMCAFEDCSVLTQINIPDSVTSIGAYAFNGCSSLPSIHISSGLKVIGDHVFASCSMLNNVVIPEGVTNILWSAFASCVSLESIVIPDGATVLGENAFQGCTNLSSVSIPASVKYVHESSFAGCEKLTTAGPIGSGCNIEFGWSESLPDNAFYGDDTLVSITLPDTITSIGNYAFRYCSALTEISIPDTVTSMGRYAFSSCSSLASVNISRGLTQISEHAFSYCSALNNVTIPDNITSIDGYAFYQCDSLESIVIPDSVTELGMCVFQFCDSLRDVTLPDTITSIGYYTFGNCVALEQITIPSSVTSIGQYAFSGCTALTEVTFEGDAPSCGYTPFSSVTATVYYPEGNTTWTEDVMAGFGGTLTWVAYTAAAETVAMDSVSCAAPTVRAIFGGEYSTEVTEDYVLKTASYTDLNPGQAYTFLSLISLDAEDPLAADNLLYIAQGVAAEDGTLVFRYVQRVATDPSYVLLCGASEKNLADAEITFPEMEADGELRAINPTVVYNGVTLTEGRDYVLYGVVDYTAAGSYICCVAGIGDYTGEVTCTYTVTGGSVLMGDVNQDGSVDNLDATLVLQYAAGWDVELDTAAADVNGDTNIDNLDATMILQYAAGWEVTFASA